MTTKDKMKYCKGCGHPKYDHSSVTGKCCKSSVKSLGRHTYYPCECKKYEEKK